MMTDPIADFLTRIRNANGAGHSKVDVPASKIKANICKVLKEEGYIKSYKIVPKDNHKLDLRISLKPGAIKGIQRVSKPGLRAYFGYDGIPRVLSGLGISIVSTSKGVISSRKARSMKAGGEVLCRVW